MHIQGPGPAADRLDNALKILDQIKNFGDTAEERVETLGLYGAVYKRKWEVDGQKLNLEHSLLYYQRGYAEGVKCKQGYAAINAAYLLELLAHQEEAEKLHDKRLAASGNGTPSGAETAALRRQQADEIRRDIIDNIPAPDPPGDYDWWQIMTVAEAHFGLKDYGAAPRCLMTGAALHDRLRDDGKGGIPDWEWESTLRQLASLARLQAGVAVENVSPEARRVLGEFIGHRFGKESGVDAAMCSDAAVRSAFVGKVGLGLSGGGFRASLFHIGVLAKLAEFDLLRRVEVLSCVSGGSIEGRRLRPRRQAARPDARRSLERPVPYQRRFDGARARGRARRPDRAVPLVATARADVRSPHERP